MTKAYWIAHVSIHNEDVYAGYRAANAAPFQRYGARFLVRGGPQQVVEGQARPRTVVIEFPSLQAAQDCYHSVRYQAAKALRDPVSAADVIIIEGWSG